MSRPPNILLVMSDEHSPRAMGCGGASFARTPNLDRLAASGVVFDAAYCNHPICVPSRNTFMSGLQSHRIRAYDNGSPLRSDLPTWAHMLARAGYDVPLFGKMHFLGPDQEHGFTRHELDGRQEIGGFRWGEETGTGEAYTCFRDIRFLDEGETVGDRRRAEAAIRYLHDAGEQPFCLTVGFLFPHYPMICDRAVWESYEGVDIPDPVRDEQLHPRHDRIGNGAWGFDRMTEQETRASRRAYLTMVTMMDDWLGSLLDALEQTGRAEDTIVVYTADHGDMWGEHGMWGKCSFLEDSARTPLVVSGPGVPAGRRVSTPVSLLDIYPTLRDLASVDDWDVPLDGRSLAPVLRGGDDPADEPVFCEYYGCDTLGPERMVRRRNWKLCYYHHQGMELFDLDADPHELRNRAGDPDAQAVLGMLLDMLHDDWDADALDADVRIEQNRRVLVGESLKTVLGDDYYTPL